MVPFQIGLTMDAAFAKCRELDALLRDGVCQSEDAAFIERLPVDGHFFLVICGDQKLHVPKFALTPAKLPQRDLRELATYFYKPNPNIKYWILKKEFRDFDFLRSQGWL
jgi:hypothetical protein